MPQANRSEVKLQPTSVTRPIIGALPYNPISLFVVPIFSVVEVILVVAIESGDFAISSEWSPVQLHIKYDI